MSQRIEFSIRQMLSATVCWCAAAAIFSISLKNMDDRDIAVPFWWLAACCSCIGAGVGCIANSRRAGIYTGMAYFVLSLLALAALRVHN
jgi:hypothetical protein